MFSAEAHGRGIASEAVQAAIRWMDMHFGGQTTTCIVRQENAASIRVAEKGGYSQFALADFKGSPVIQFRRGPSAGSAAVGV